MSRILANIIIAVCIQASVLGAESRASTEPSDSTIVFGVDSTATLDTYIGIALKNRSGLKSSHAKWQESLAMKGSAGALENPILSYSYGYNKFSQPVGPDRQKFGIMQPLPWLGLLGARKNAAALNADADYQSFLAEELATVYAVKSAYYEYYYVAKQLALTSESFNLMRQFEEVIRTRYQAGLAMHPDLIKAQLELGQMEEMIRSMEQMLLPAKARILALLNLPQDARLPEPIARHSAALSESDRGTRQRAADRNSVPRSGDVPFRQSMCAEPNRTHCVWRPPPAVIHQRGSHFPESAGRTIHRRPGDRATGRDRPRAPAGRRIRVDRLVDCARGEPLAVAGCG